MLTREQLVIARNTSLSDNFSLYELINSDSHPELVEWPSEEVIEHLKDFAQNILQPIRDKWGRISIRSGFRNNALNRQVGGVADSVHQIFYKEVFLGVAADIDPLDAKLEDVFDWAFENLEDLKTAIIYRKPTVVNNPFIHLDTRLGRAKKAKMEKIGPNKYVAVS